MSASREGVSAGRTTASGLALAALVLTALAGALWLLGSDGSTAIAGSVLLSIAALAGAAVLLGGAPYGPEVEGELDLSSRLALGLLGGLLGALLAAGLGWLLGVAGLPGWLGVAPPSDLAGAPLPARLAAGAGWGLVFGVVLPGMPGRGVLARGAVFSLVPSLWTLLKVYPVDRDLGLLGVELGALAFLFVLSLNLAWGVVAAWVLAWGERTELAPLDRPLGA